MRIADAKDWLERIRALRLSRRIRIMNVCGGHERTITMAGLRTALPENIEIIPGPGCPVCVCPEEDLFTAIQLALHENLTLLTFGDLLRVPILTHRDSPRTLEIARARGADIRPIASPREAIKLALADPKRRVVLFAVGFETTMAPIAALLVEGTPPNLLCLISGRLTWPAVAMLLSANQPGFDALIAPGHVATVMGPAEWQFVVEQYAIPTAVAGFTPTSLLAAIYSVVRQVQEQHQFLDNCYPESVKPTGNPTAQRHLKQAFNIVDANWRGIGVIPNSGFALAAAYQNLDALLAYPAHATATKDRSVAMPTGCECAKVLLGRCYPNDCRLFGTACQPRHPVGPCMVSDEGACRIWWSGGMRKRLMGKHREIEQL